MINYIKNIFSRKKKRNSKVSISNSFESGGLDESFLFDFKNYSSGYRGGIVSGTYLSVDMGDMDDSANGSPRNPSLSKKIAIKPIDVLDQLETVPTPWSLSNLEDKIEVLKYKRDLIVQKYSKREVEGLIERLENRRKYDKFKKFFDSFQNTTDEKIDLLLEKYDLVMETSDLFVPEFPDDAIKVMKDYTKNMEKLCGKKPVFYVIAEPEKFRKAYEKRDPILLVQSPFGFYWQILGAWDKEMILLSEL